VVSIITDFAFCTGNKSKLHMSTKVVA